MSASPSVGARQRPPVKVVCVTMGGPRRKRMERMFGVRQPSGSDAAEGGVGDIPPAALTLPGFEVHFSSGVPQRSLRTREGMLAALRAAGLLLPDSDAAQEQRCWIGMRHLNRDRAVLACTLAHLAAMRLALELGCDAVLEDNVVGPADAAARLRHCADACPDADLVYFAYGGRPEEIVAWRGRLGTPAPPAVPWPTIAAEEAMAAGGGISHAAGKKRFNILWGTLCYGISARAYHAILAAIRSDLPGALAWTPKRQKRQIAKPADKIFPRLVLSAGLRIRVAPLPAFVRAPVPSTIHTDLDTKFWETSATQLRLSGLGWADLRLSAEELNRVSSGGGAAGTTKDMYQAVAAAKKTARERRKPVPPTRGTALACNECHVVFPSRNLLFKHLRDVGSPCGK